jgi:hypothetical protein
MNKELDTLLTKHYTEIMTNKSLYFLQIFPQLFDDTNIAETFMKSDTLKRIRSNNY